FSFPPTLTVVPVLSVFVVMFVLFPRHVLLFPEKAAYPSGERIAFYDLGRHIKMEDPGRFRITKDDLRQDLYFTSWRRVENLELRFGSLEGTYRITLKFFDREIFRGTTSREFRTITLPSPPYYRFRRTHLYKLRLELENLSDVLTAENPYALSVRPIREPPDPGL
ncbi:MAG: hypothetical protein ACE5LV_06855, partial [Candidatus Aminicenantales bacterium]